MNALELTPGHVYIVGAGPGDPGLITLKGARCLEAAEVVLYDEILDRRLLGLARPDCEKIYVGKRGGHKSHTQEEINRLLIRHAREGRSVVRLKGGDPLIFGRGSEEALLLQKAGIPFEIVSGVSAAAGALAYAGIPLTHRGLAAAAVLVTGHEDPAKSAPTTDWPLLARLDSTLVIFMGARKLDEISATLLQHGRSPDTPAAAIEWGTWPHQRTLVSSLKGIAGEAHRQNIQSPALIVVGDVVSLRSHLNWFEDKALFGRRVLITRSREQAGSLQLLLEAEAAEVSVMPLLDIQPPEDWAELDQSIAELERFHWLVFASPNSVDFFFRRLRRLNRDSRALGSASVAAVGLSTAAHLRDQGIEPDLIPARHSQDGLVEAFSSVPVEDCRVLMPGSSIGRALLATELERRGARVRRVTAYRNRPPDPGEVDLPAALVEGNLDLIVFVSPSSVHNFGKVLGAERTRSILAENTIASIGPTTTRAILDLGLETHIQPEESSIPALVRSICNHYRGRRP